MIEFKQKITPLLSKEKIFIFDKYFNAYDNLMQSIEFYYKQNNDTYYFICATYYIELLLNGLADITPKNPCQLLSDYLDNYRDLDFANNEKSMINDKDNFIQNIQLFIDNYRNHQGFCDKDDLIVVCNDLIEFIKLSQDNDLVKRYG
ncbi:Uncharacterised protein [Moraxella lacunata]|uniref:Uncharacterized protein n=1 Tax=Moraxella lacunata TaxID=477 RepID=A0A378TUM5_MORLA|nr:hypothetical protein [Moraxella lacunata]STZ63670.1 Uncharacterised protein [Moraxella lacunata]